VNIPILHGVFEDSYYLMTRLPTAWGYQVIPNRHSPQISSRSGQFHESGDVR
jgi:hypothetical protein